VTGTLQDRVAVEVAYAEPERQFLETLELPAGTTAGEAVARSGLKRAFPALDFSVAPIGVWGTPVERGHVLADGDRVEVYRPLAMDPREARRQLAARGGAMGRKDGPVG